MAKPAALVVGRFQPFHLGHLALVEAAAKESSRVLIGIGSSQESRTKENPFSAGERREMILASLPRGRKFSVIDVPDVNDDARWASHVKKLCPGFDVVYTNGEREKRLFSEAGFPVRSTHMFCREKYWGTEVRRRMAAGEEWESLVPAGAAEVLLRIGGVAIVKNLGVRA